MGMSGMKRHLGGPFSIRVRLLVFGFAGASYRNARIQECTLSFKSRIGHIFKGVHGYINNFKDFNFVF